MSPELSAVETALEEVLDPCSCFGEEPIDVVSMGLIDAVDIGADGTVEIDLLPTTPLCLYAAQIIADIEARVGSLPGVEAVRVRQVTDEIWTRERLDDDFRRRQRRRLRERAAADGLTPWAAGEERSRPADGG